MKKGVKIALAVVGSIVALAGIFWSVMAICAHYGLDHLYDAEADIM